MPAPQRFERQHAGRRRSRADSPRRQVRIWVSGSSCLVPFSGVLNGRSKGSQSRSCILDSGVESQSCLQLFLSLLQSELRRARCPCDTRRKNCSGSETKRHRPCLASFVDNLVGVFFQLEWPLLLEHASQQIQRFASQTAT